LSTESEQTVLVVNPGGTSTKVAVFHGEQEVHFKEIRHSSEDFYGFASLQEQLALRLSVVRDTIEEMEMDMAAVDAVAGRGGPVAPVPCGTFTVDEAMMDAIREGRVMVEHPSLLGAPMAMELAEEANCLAYVVDPVSVDEFVDEARITGLPDISRRALSHALGIKAAAREAASRLGKGMDKLNLVVLHLGSGFTVAAQRRGRQIDSTDASASGPMAPTRTGSLPALDLLRLAFSGKYTLDEMERLLVGGGGWIAHLGTDDIREVHGRIDEGNSWARHVLDATLLQLAKETAGMAAALGGEVDAIVVTGGVARSDRFVEELKERISWMGDEIIVLPGENEMQALARGAMRVLAGESEALSMGPYIEKMTKERL